MSYIVVSKPPIKKNNSNAVQWKLESTTSDSVDGYRFAATIAALASGASIDKIAPKPTKYPVKKVFWEETRFNPPLAYGHIDYAIDAHIKLAQANWKRGGKKFRTGLRFEVEREVLGPLIPEQHRQFFEKPTKTFGRRRELNHLDVARAYNRPAERFNDTCVTEKNRKDQRTAMLGPLTYKLPDLWPAPHRSSAVSLSGKSRSSHFASGTLRFKDQLSLYTPYHIEKEGTSIPISRGHNQSAGEGSLFDSSHMDGVAPMDSMTSWDTHDESNAANSPVDASQANAAYRAQSAQLRRGRSGLDSLSSSGASIPKARMKAFRAESPTKRTGQSKSPSRSKLQLTRSHMPGFSFVTKTEEQVKGAHDASKVYKRVKLPDGTPVIVPVFIPHGDAPSTAPMAALGSSSLASLGMVEQSLASLDQDFDCLQVSGSQILNARRTSSAATDDQSSVGDSNHSFHDSLMDSPLGDTSNDVTRITLSSMPPKPLTPKMYKNKSKLINHSMSSLDLGMIEPYHRNIIEKWKTPLYYSNKKLNIVPDVGGVLVQAGTEWRRKAVAGALDVKQQSHLSSYSYNILANQERSRDPDYGYAASHDADSEPYSTSTITGAGGITDETVLSPPPVMELTKDDSSPLLTVADHRDGHPLSGLVFDDAISLNSRSTR